MHERTGHSHRSPIACIFPPDLLRDIIRGGAGGKPHRTIYDQGHASSISLGTVARSEGGKAVKDPAVNEAYDGFGATYKFYWDNLGRNSIDNAGMPILGLVHYSTKRSLTAHEPDVSPDLQAVIDVLLPLARPQ